LPLQFLKRWLTFQVHGDELSCDENSDAKLDDESQEIGDDNGPEYGWLYFCLGTAV
jgi:hypothetical protein